MLPWVALRQERLRQMADECRTVPDFGQSAREDGKLFSRCEYATCDIDESTGPDIVADICHLNLVADASIDGVVCISVLEHVYDPFGAIAEIHRILRPGEPFFGCVPFVYLCLPKTSSSVLDNLPAQPCIRHRSHRPLRRADGNVQAPLCARDIAPRSAASRLDQHDGEPDLGAYARYYNETRTHLAFGKETPEPRPVQRVGRIVGVPLLGGLHHRYVRI